MAVMMSDSRVTTLEEMAAFLLMHRHYPCARGPGSPPTHLMPLVPRKNRSGLRKQEVGRLTLRIKVWPPAMRRCC